MRTYLWDTPPYGLLHMVGLLAFESTPLAAFPAWPVDYGKGLVEHSCGGSSGMDKAFTGFPVIPYQEPYAIIILFLSQSNDSVKGSKISGALVKKENKTCNAMNYLKIKK